MPGAFGLVSLLLGAGPAQAVTIQTGEIWEARVEFPLPSFPPEFPDAVANILRIAFNLGADPINPGEALRIRATNADGTVLIDETFVNSSGGTALIGSGAGSVIDPALVSGLVYDVSVSVTGGSASFNSLFASLAFVGPPVERCFPFGCFNVLPFPVTGSGPINAVPLLVERSAGVVPLPATALLLLTGTAAIGSIRRRSRARQSRRGCDA
ncbi:MAG: VPLPA-CTERM sorting domain-containing protein [Pseudomonadota bacterium]